MTTRLSGDKTSFLPFNKGCDGGKGNPDNPDGLKKMCIRDSHIPKQSSKTADESA